MQNHSEKVSKQLLETQQALLKRGRAMEESSADDTAKGAGKTGLSNKKLKAQKFFAKAAARRQEQQQKKWGDFS